MEGRLVNAHQRRIEESRGRFRVLEGSRLVGEFVEYSDALECAGFPDLLVAARAALTSLPVLSGSVRVPLRQILSTGINGVGHRG